MSNPRKITRRSLLGSSALLAGIAGESVPAEAAPGVGFNPYEPLGVTPVVNCRGTFTIISGSQSLPEVKRAMEAASRYYVNIDELMDAVGQRLAALTQAEWGIVTGGCAAALTHATSACITGGDPEKMQRLPNLTGMKNEVVVPKYSRNVYDHAVRMPGVKMIEVETAEQFEKALGLQTAMVMILSCPAAEKGELSIPGACAIAKRKGVPVIVDAAAEDLTIPNLHLGHGATMVAYSGGKCLRGPQAAGLLLGRKDLVQTAWINSAPHHAFGRSLKIGKEEIMGMLAAVEAWTKRDHDAEWRQWQGWLDSIAASAMQTPGVTKTFIQPQDLSNHAPQLRLSWDPQQAGITGAQVQDLLLNGKPRIVVASANANSITIMPYMMMPGDDKIAGNAIHRILSNPPHIETPSVEAAAVDVNGAWLVHMKFRSGTAAHRFEIAQDAGKLNGTYNGETISGRLGGSVEGKIVRIHTSQKIEGTSLDYNFTGTVEGDTMRGTVKLSEYGPAEWTAHREKA